MKNITFKVLRQQAFNADDLMSAEQALSRLGGCGDNGNQFGLGAWQMEFDVEVTNQENETRLFTVVFQPEERNNGMKNYSGCEVETAGRYGCDADESTDLLLFLDGSYDAAEIIDALHDIAHETAKAELERLLSDTRFFMNPHTGSVDTMVGWADEGYTPEDCDLIEVFYDDGAWVEVE